MMEKKGHTLETRSIFHGLAGLDLIFVVAAAVIALVIVVEAVLR
jgi:hypothetical protein